MRIESCTVLLLGVASCGAHVTPAEPVPARSIGSCTLEVLPLPPQAPYLVLGQGYSDNMSEPSVSALFQKGCELGADALVAPLPPAALGNGKDAQERLAGTFIRRCPATGCPQAPATR